MAIREIEFRAKSKNEKVGWVYGCPVFNEDNNEYELRPETHTAFHIKQETVGQYMGSKDKNDKKIFEGDIVKAHCIEFVNSTPYEKDFVVRDEFDAIGKVVFKDGCFIIKWINLFVTAFVHEPVYLFLGGLQRSESSMLNEFEHRYKLDKLEVIGNLYDNPELLGETI